MKINWKQKLTSRKFWSAVVGFVVPILLAFGVSDSNATQTRGAKMTGMTGQTMIRIDFAVRT